MSACVCGKPKNHCDPCSHVVATTNRGTGRTSRMLMSLPPASSNVTVTVVVHTQEMADYVRRLARQLQPDDLKHPIRVRIVRSTRDCDYLRGCDFVVDHAALERVHEPVASLMRAMSKRRDLMKWTSNP